MKNNNSFKIYFLFLLLVVLIIVGLVISNNNTINYFHNMFMGGNMMGHGNLTKNVNLNEKLIYGDSKNISFMKKQEVVNLKDGDNYIIEITKVKNVILNKEIEMLAYNGSIPGPIIKAKVGTKAKITIVNKVKDLETTLHSYGLRLSDMFDGVVKDMKGSQDPIKYNDSFTYEVSFPDVGVFWYHPHLREDVQQELGLYGNYIVEPKDDNYYSKVNNEVPIILDDIAMQSDGLKPFYRDFTNYVLMGRFGNTMFLNGTQDFKLQMKKGEVTRVYLTNVANTRVFNFKAPGIKMKLVGSDIGKYEKEKFIDNVIISPGERYIVDLYAKDSGTFNMYNSTYNNNIILGNILVSNDVVPLSFFDNFNLLKTNNDIVSDIDNYRKYFDKDIDKNLSLELGTIGKKGGLSERRMGNMMHNMMGETQVGSIEWEDNMYMMNKSSTSLDFEWKIIDKNTKKENMDIDWDFNKGDIVKIRVENKVDGLHPMQHPFHIHGQRFLVLNINGEKQENLVWKDTVLIRSGDVVDLLVEMNNTGSWMAHCHISEHLFSGMMMNFNVK